MTDAPAAEPSPSPPPGKGKNRTMVLVLVALGVGAVLLPCVGVLAAVGIPAFIQYTKRAKIAEATANLRALYTGAAGYYAQEHRGPAGEVLTHCTVAAATSANAPSAEPRVVSSWPASFEALGFAPADPLRYRYEIVSDGRCGHAPGDMNVYTFRAHGDLDEDGVESMFELAAGSQAETGELFRAPGIYRLNELE